MEKYTLIPISHSFYWYYLSFQGSEVDDTAKLECNRSLSLSRLCKGEGEPLAWSRRWVCQCRGGKKYSATPALS